MRDFSVIQNIYSHPLNAKQRFTALLRFIKWQASTILFPFPVVYPFIENSVLVVERGMTGATGNIYNGLHEYREMLFVLHFLRRDDLFVDVGANIGSYTILAAVNRRAKVFAFEPVPSVFERLARNVRVNNVYERVTLFNLAIGRTKKTLTFTASLDAGNHAITAHETETVVEANQVEVCCVTLDEAVSEEPDLIKIDVEGFETEVIEGGERIFSSKNLKAVIIELNGMGSRYGYDDRTIHEKLLGYGFLPFSYDPFKKHLQSVATWGSHNTIYIRDIDFVQQRIESSKRFKVNNLIL